MQQNPLFPSSAPDDSQIPDYLRINRASPQTSGARSDSVIPGAAADAAGGNPFAVAGPTVAPIGSVTPDTDGSGAAADLIRQKLAAIYADEPSAQGEIREVQAAQVPLSKHQQFMQGLQQSGRSMAEIQTAWHEYYSELSTEEKYEVWQEYNTAQPQTPFIQQLQERDQVAAHPEPQTVQPSHPVISKFMPHRPAMLWPQSEAVQSTQPDNQISQAVVGLGNDSTYQPPKPRTQNTEAEHFTVADIKQKILTSVNSAAQLHHKSIFHSLAFGLACGAAVLLLFMFSFFNEVFISPFIQPPRHAIETPVIVGPSDKVASTNPEVIIPKINVEIPVDYSQTTTNEAAIETALDSAVVHYPTTVLPGQTGNAAYFGHSSNNIFNPGKYKFAFVLLHTLKEGDTFYLTNAGKTYTYEVISHQIVEPTDVGVLGPVEGQTATATLITCDPPGTSLHRLVVVGKQISPDPGSNTAPATTPPTPVITATETGLPGNGQTLFGRLWHSIF